MPAAKKTLEDVLDALSYETGVVKIGELSIQELDGEGASEVRLIEWDLHFTQDTLNREQVPILEGGWREALGECSEEDAFSVMFAPDGISTQDACRWLDAAALLGFDVFSNLEGDGGLSLVTVVRWGDYDVRSLASAVKELENGDVGVIYAPALDGSDNGTLRDVTGGQLTFRHNLPAKHPSTEKELRPRRKAARTPIFRYTGALSGAVGENQAQCLAYKVYKAVTGGIESIMSEQRRFLYSGELPAPEEFVDVMSYGHCSLPPKASAPRLSRLANRMTEVLSWTNVVDDEDARAIADSQAALDVVNNYWRIWKECAEPYGIQPSSYAFFYRNRARIYEMAELIGATSSIEAYASGVSIDDVLA